MIRVVADENIPAIERALPGEIDLRLLPGREISPATVRGADALLVRSVTRVDASLLQASSVRFVASATAGLDHVDVDWLEREGIRFAWASGSNAESVAQYVAAALLHEARRTSSPLKGRTLGIVGVGQCGSRVERIARALGMAPVLCDPPLARAEDGSRFLDLEYLIETDFLTLHVPLTEEGRNPTRGLISRSFIEAMRPDATIINASRGGVLDEAALIEALDDRRVRGAVIDAWIGEPRINRELLTRVSLGTPHIAGYSADGKIRGTAMIARAFASAFDLDMTWRPEDELPSRSDDIDLRDRSGLDALAAAVRHVYPIERDSAALTRAVEMSPGAAAAHFDRLRKDYPPRREFAACLARVDAADEALAAGLSGLGFTVEKSSR